MRYLIFATIVAVLSSCGSPTPTFFYNPSAYDHQKKKPAVVILPAMKFYDINSHEDAPCRTGIRADLQARGNRFTGVILRNFSEGSCEHIATPNPRFYNFEIIATQCGSVTYSGTLETAETYSAIVFTDHGERRCTDHRPATYEIEETLPGQITRKFYGGWSQL